MKKIIFLSISIVLGISLFAQTSPLLKFKLETNKTYSLKFKQEQNINITINGIQQTPEVKMITFVSLKPIHNEADFFNAEVRFDTIQYSNTAPGTIMDVNSSKIGNMKSSDASDVMACILNRFSKSVFMVKMSYSGEVLEIANVKFITDSILLGIDSLQIKSSNRIQMHAKMLINPTTIKGLLGTITSYLPGKEVQIGDSWIAHTTQSSGAMEMLITNTFKLNKVVDNNVQISSNETILLGNSAPMEMNGAQISYDLKGLGLTNMLVNSKSGWIVSRSSKAHIQGYMIVKVQGNEMQMPMVIDQKTEMISIP